MGLSSFEPAIAKPFLPGIVQGDRCEGRGESDLSGSGMFGISEALLAEVKKDIVALPCPMVRLFV